MTEHLLLNGKAFAVADKRMNNETVKKLWRSFTFTEGELNLEKGETLTFRIGNTPLPTLPEGKEYALTVDGDGAAIVGKNYGGLMRGFFSLLLKIELEKDGLKIKAVNEESGYIIKNRMIHICIFPENDIYFIKKLIRLSALCQYTHIVIEFWGMLKFDCLKELSWPQAYTKDQVKELIKECRELGIEPIPMFNQLGHASSSRECYGKHVVLDQNPRLQRLFSPDGWAWNIESEEVFTLLGQVREELYRVFGEGEYMHLGFDEARCITQDKNLRAKLPDYLSRLTRQVESEGRRPMLWMDMLQEKGAFPGCYTSGEKDEVEALRGATADSTVFVDWQYNYFEAPIPSLVSLKDCGRDVMGAPWFDERNYTAHVKTVAEGGMHGVMLTTWHTLKERIPHILGCAKKCGAVSFVWSAGSIPRLETAALMRRVSFEGNAYPDCGWAKEQIDI